MDKLVIDLFQSEANGIIDTDSVQYAIMISKKEKIKKIHPYSVTPPSEKDRRWQTCFKSTDGKKKHIKAQTEDELWNKLVQLYSVQEQAEKQNFYNLYCEWLDYKRTITNSPNTIKRHEQHYKKYFADSVLNAKSINSIDELFLEKFCNSIIKEHNLTRKEWTNIKTILNGCFDYACRSHYISDNPMAKINIYVKYRQVVRKTGATQTYNTDELKHLNNYLDDMYSKTKDTVFLAVKLNFLLGLRVGELVALKFSDVCGHKLHIVREEIRNQESNEVEIVEHTKTHTDRFVVLIPQALDILNSIPQTSEFIFVRDTKRITARQISYVLEKYAERQGLKTKSTHKMRKTYASNLNANGVPLDAIREQLGHSDLHTTMKYIFNPLTENETYELITKALTT